MDKIKLNDRNLQGYLAIGALENRLAGAPESGLFDVMEPAIE